jgi:hypothetical protein
MSTLPLWQASCASCLLGVSRTAQGGYPVIRCIRTSSGKNPHDCCRFFLAPSAGFEYPKSSIRDAVQRPDLPPSGLVFSPTHGLIKEFPHE